MNENLLLEPNRRRHVRRQRPLWRKLLDYLLAAALLFGLILLVARLNESSSVTRTGTAIVNDGDSITLNAARIRLWGIDAPELHQTCTSNGKTYSCGALARDALRKMVRDRKVDCKGNEQDQYERLLAICTVESIELNKAMVEAGWAVSYGGYQSQESAARRARRGVWQGEFERPRAWRQHPGQPVKPDNDFLAYIGDALRKWLSSLFG